MITPTLANEIRALGKEVITLKHAFRVDGVIDIWFNGKTLFDIKKNKYLKFQSTKDQLHEAFKLLENTEAKDAFKKLPSGRMSYKEFSNRGRDSNPIAEYYLWQNDKSKSEDFLYIFKSGFNVKIGRSVDPKKRIKEIQTGCASKLTIALLIPNKGHLERGLHKAFSEWRREGEWFFYSEQIKNFILYVKGKP
jgi:hypothetical protein